MAQPLHCQCGHEWSADLDVGTAVCCPRCGANQDPSALTAAHSVPVPLGPTERLQASTISPEQTVGFTLPTAVVEPPPNDATLPLESSGSLPKILHGPRQNGDRPKIPGTNIPLILPGYDILEVIGRGGMGVVYKAKQLGLNRFAAVKMILASLQDLSEERYRFQTEAEAVAKLVHPNIVQIYEVGDNQGSPFLTLEYIEGGTLGAKLQTNPLPARQAAELVEPLARAMHYAHERGILHRDIKPTNILLTLTGTPKITDFGLAKQIGEGSQDHTGTGSILGTPSYMAPEQAEGKIRELGPGVDIYALGALLYHALTGRPPFVGETVLDTIQQVKNDDPVPPRRLQPKVPCDLETICLKSLQKDPRKRYLSAQALADDLKAFLDNQPIKARPVGLSERAVKWMKRSPGVAALLAILAVVVVGGFFGMMSLWLLADAKRAQAEIAEKKAGDESQRARTAEALTQKELDFSERSLYAAQMNLAQDALTEGKITRLRDLLEKPNEKLIGFEFNLLKKLTQSDQLVLKGHTKLIVAVAFRPPAGRQFATGSEDGSVVLWDPSQKGGKRFQRLDHHQGPVRSLRFSGDGQFLASASEDGTVKLWDLDKGTKLFSFKAHERRINAVAFHPEALSLATGSDDASVKVWKIETGTLEATLAGHTYPVADLAYSPDGLRLASASFDKTVRFWDIAEKTQSGLPCLHSHWVTALAYSPDGNTLASSSWDNQLTLWNPFTSEIQFQLDGLKSPARSLAYNPSGKLLAASCNDQSIVVWDLPQKKLFKTLPGEAGKVRTVAFSAAGDLLATVTFDLNQAEYKAFPAPSSLLGVSFGGTRDEFAAAGADGSLYAWNLKKSDVPTPYAVGQGALHSVAYAPGWGWTTGSEAGKIEFRREPSINGSGYMLTPPAHKRWIRAVVWSGGMLASASDDRTIQVLASPTSWLRLEGHPDAIRALALSGEGSRLVSGGVDGALFFWNPREGKLLASWTTLAKGAIHALAYHPKESRIAFAGNERTITLFDPDAGRAERVLRGHTHPIHALAFSPDGKRLASGSEDGTVKIWDVATGQEMLTLKGHKLGVTGVAFSADGNRLISSSWDQSVLLWDAE